MRRDVKVCTNPKHSLPSTAGDVSLNGDSCDADTKDTNGADCADVALDGTCFVCGFLSYKIGLSSASVSVASVAVLAASAIFALSF